MALYCQYCGSALPDNVNFCPQCGAAVSSSTVTGSSANTGNTYTQQTSSASSDALKTAATVGGVLVGASALSRLARSLTHPRPRPHHGPIGGSPPMRRPMGGPPMGGHGGPGRHGGHGGPGGHR